MGTTVNTNPVVLTAAEIDVIGPKELTYGEIGDMIENLTFRFTALEEKLDAAIAGLNAVGTMQNQVNEMVQGFTSQASAAMSGGGLGGLLMKAMGGKGTPNG